MMIWGLRAVTWFLIGFSYAITGYLLGQLRADRKLINKLADDNVHLATIASFTMMKLQMVAPGTKVELPDNTGRWMEAQALEYMVYGPGDPE